MPALGLSIARAILNPSSGAAPPALGTPTVIGTPTFSNTGSGPTSVATVPTGVQDGDLLIVAHAANNGGTYNTPAGWTRFDAVDSDRMALFYRYASSEPASYNFTIAVGNAKSIAMIALRDVAASNPIQTYTFNSGASSTTVTATGLTTANDNTFLLQTVATGGGRTASASTLTELWEVASTTNIGCGAVQATAGASGNKTVTLNSAAAWYTFLIAIKPSGGV